MRTVFILVGVLVLGCGNLPIRDCSDLLRENDQLNKDLRRLKSEYRREKEMNHGFKIWWWDRINEHEKGCTNGAVGMIGSRVREFLDR